MFVAKLEEVVGGAVVGALGWLFSRATIEQVIAGIFGAAASILYVAGSTLPAARPAAPICLLLGAMSHVFLPWLQPHYSLQGYGQYRWDAAAPLLSPPQPRRGQLRADQGPWFRDTQGRRLLLRGVNLAGSSKFPLNAPTHTPAAASPSVRVSFVGRPLPLEQADEHFGRLRAWGLTFVRLLVTWEAVEHAGPGIYDEEYLEYLLQTVKKADEYGITCFIDPHQDVWSRATGGDGAPEWTLDLVGFNVSALHSSGAAFTHEGHRRQTPNEPLPRMVWLYLVRLHYNLL